MRRGAAQVQVRVGVLVVVVGAVAGCQWAATCEGDGDCGSNLSGVHLNRDASKWEYGSFAPDAVDVYLR